eukprot:CAMPEP_0119304936 /NCGR_PEP_ID=MMETSP1333-20130426/6050_1 /TAXON_ID=418940 /ORGANISM="Scyphosphaera apsteinii, Strain RCC1455" /LENGTH=164 /DNA_ID=CAMNT_0007307915 /DNA_START=45 /DNA_END=539 /DNA_ORIENTATION=+
MVFFFALLAFTPPKYPFPQDCSTVHGALTPKWFTGCDKAIDSCYKVTIPPETSFNVGNTSRTSCDALGHCNTNYGSGMNWCVDHINGVIFTKSTAIDSVMFFEVDDTSPQPPGVNAPSCRFSIGLDDAKKNETKVYKSDRLTCAAASKPVGADGITYANISASK